MFERQSMEQIVNKMIRWTRGTTTKITDFRVGSKVRTLYEAIGVVVEELYDKVYRAIKQTVEANIYAVIGFNKLPATYASGKARMSRSTASPDNYFIPAGTVVLSKATQYTAPKKYRTIEDALLEVGKTFIDVPIIANESGEAGNVGANEIVEFLQKPVGIESVSNPSAIDGGKPEETIEEQKARFQTFIQANARGITQAVEYGASLARVYSTDGSVIERVRQAVTIEDLVNRKGEVDVYIWNGTGNASTTLIDNVKKRLTGYYDADGNPVYGYKPAGILTNIYTAKVKNVTLKLEITTETWSSSSEVNPEAEHVIDVYFGNLQLGETFIQTALEAEVKYIEGIKDVKLYVSTDGGTTYNTSNVTALKSEIIVPNKPINFV